MKKLFILLLISFNSVAKKDPRILLITLESVEHDSTNGEGYHSGNNFQDNLISIKWSYTNKSLDFTLQNKADRTIKVIWEDASYINEYGHTVKIIHSGTDKADRYKQQLPTAISKGGVIFDGIIPASKVVELVALKEFAGYQGYASKELFKLEGWTKAETNKLWEQANDKNISVVLPIIYNGQTFEYIFHFKTKVSWKD